MTNTCAEKLAARFAGMKYNDTPEASRHAVKRLLLDYLGVAVGGSQTQSGKVARAFALDQGGKGESRVIGDNARVSMTNAAFANAISSHSLELDDIDVLALFHFSPPVCSAALAAGCEMMERASLATYPRIPYDTAKDFAPINTVALTPEVIAVHPSVPANTLSELVALSKKKQVTLSSSGSGGLPHLAIELLKNVSQGDFLHVPYKGAGPAVIDTIGGHVQGIVMDLPAVATQVKEGKLRALAVTNRQRTSILPELATSGEQGLAGVQAVNWFALMAPRGTPPAVVAKLNDALVKTVSQPQVKEQFANIGVEVFTQPSPEAFRRFLDEEIVRWGRIARDAGAKAE